MAPTRRGHLPLVLAPNLAKLPELVQKYRGRECERVKAVAEKHDLDLCSYLRDFKEALEHFGMERLVEDRRLGE